MKLTINEREYEFKTAFAEFTIDEYLAIISRLNAPLVERINILTGIPIEVLNGLTIENFSQISALVGFTEDYKLLSALSEPYNGKDVGLESFAKLEAAKGLISKGVTTLPEIAKIYTGNEFKGKNLLEAWNVCNFYLTSLNAFFARFAKMNLHEQSDEELEAGVEVFEGFKHYPIVFEYGKKRGMTNDEVLALPAIEIYTELLYDFEKSEYEKRYTQIMQNRAEHFAKLNQ